MRVIVQRVKKAKVEIDGSVAGEIGKGLLLLPAVAADDNEKILDWTVNKITGLRVFPDDEGVMNISAQNAGAELLAVSNFTVLGETKKGFRPSWSKAAPPEIAEPMYEKFIEKLKETGLKVETGKFQAEMDISLVNWGPVTLIVEKSLSN